MPIPARDRLLRECWAMAEQPRALARNRIGETPLTLRLLPQLLCNAFASLAKGPDPMSQGSAEGCLGPVWWSGLQLSRHAAVLVMHWEERPWIVILSKDGARVAATYPSDERTVTNRRVAGRWMDPAN